MFERFVAEYYGTSPDGARGADRAAERCSETEAAGRVPGGAAGHPGGGAAGRAGRQAPAAGAGRPERHAGPGSRAAAGGAQPRAPLRGARPRCEQALGLDGAAHAHRGLRHLQPGGREHRGLHGGLRGRRAPRRATTASSPSGPPAARTTWAPCGRLLLPAVHARAEGPVAAERLRPLVRGRARPGARRRGQGPAGRGAGALCARPGWRTRWRWCRWPSERRRSSCPGRPDPLGLPAGRPGSAAAAAGCATRPTASLWASTARGGRRRRPLSHARPASGDRGEAEEGDHAAFRVAGAVPARHRGRSSRRCPDLPGKVAREVYAYVHKTG